MKETGKKMRISWGLTAVKLEEKIYKQDRYRVTKMYWNEKRKGDMDQYSQEKRHFTTLGLNSMEVEEKQKGYNH